MREQRWLVLAICATSIFLVGLDTTAVNVALPAIGDDLRLAIADLEWAVDAYALVLAGLMITSGALADRIGRRRVFRLGLVLFGAGSVACALAPSIGVLVAARALQGVGGSMLSPVALAIVVSVITDPRERARMIGVWAAVFGLSMAAGPVLGGALITGLGWRTVFWANLPIIAVVLVLTALFVPESRAPKARRLDLPGQILLVVLLGATVAVLIEGPRLGWTSPALLAGYPVIAAALVAFVRVESRTAEPLIDLGLFRRPPFAAAIAGAVAVFVAFSVTLLLGTLYLQQVRGLRPIEAGLFTLPMALATTVCAPLSGHLVGRLGPRLPLRLAGTCTVIGGALLVGLGDRTGTAHLLVAYLFAGIGLGFANAPITNTAVSGLPPERSGLAGGIASTARQVGAALGVAIAGGMVAGLGPDRLAGATRPGWVLVAACGLVILAVAQASPSGVARTTAAQPGPVAAPAR
ncbi:EmrB/QacA subfamily drug resistance transporter [Actinoplanes campanulatus]|uniref:EmrB/QacA subfamily drug resistance transporter n=1 Tax=Actinoplanes campanulatus TaxID=113559 RepID=A0A7W5FEM8_9ACTN|nr:MFS transporter [Actinoplanes campanulatus]MBB3095576.1 EmrB/QacA subfamily drug resistance transporter [Actinoplanes campanulatus]